MRRIVYLLAGVMLAASPAAAAAPHFSSCKDFKAHLAAAEQTVGIVLPEIAFSDSGVSNNRHTYDADHVKGFDVELVCTLGGNLDTFEITQTDVDAYSSIRFVDMAIAAVWSYTQWPRDKADHLVKLLIARTAVAARASRIRGEEFDDGSSYFDLGHNIDVRMSGGHSFGLYLLIDASAAEEAAK